MLQLIENETVSNELRSPRSAGAEGCRLWRELRPEIARMARRLTHHAADAEDLVQIAFLRLLEHTEIEPRAGSRSLQAWLKTVVRRLAIDRSRRQRRWSCAPTQDQVGQSDGGDCALPAWSSVSSEQLRAAIGGCKPIYRQVFVLHYERGQSYEQIARDLALPLGTVATRLHRARASIRAQLESTGSEAAAGKNFAVERLGARQRLRSLPRGTVARRAP